jgi:hypothetical protein
MAWTKAQWTAWGWGVTTATTVFVLLILASHVFVEWALTQ